MRYLITGHTGFKGAWLSLWLAEQGHDVIGLALDPRPGGIFQRADVANLLKDDLRLDIRDAVGVADVVSSAQPDVVLHLAAQPLVRESYADPRTTITTNVEGTLNVLAAMQPVKSIRAAVIVTTDKVYRNVNQVWGYREDDPLGGDDPYSASKAMADLLTQSWARSFPGGPPTAVARAGNVIGGGDVSPDRLLPDLIRSHQRGERPHLRYPQAVRPWQHVLDCLNGYLTLTEALLDGRGQGEWNFGPGLDSFVTVGQVADLVATDFGAPTGYTLADHQPHEAGLLALDSRKARIELGWRNHLGFHNALAWTIAWERDTAAGHPAATVTRAQLRDFEALRDRSTRPEWPPRGSDR
jgi:CDP-glucose 4,6-dehydratase